MAAKKKAAKKAASTSSYDAKDILVLEGLDPVRKRPGMYIGSTGSKGLHHLIWEVADNSVDEAMAGYATNVIIELLNDGSIAVSDDGRGIPVAKHPQTKKSTLETVLTVLHAGGKFGGEGYKVSGGLHGVGVSVVNALSTYLRAEVKRDGHLYVQEYKKGEPQGAVKKTGKAEGTGTKIVFMPDPEIFSEIEFSLRRVLEHVRQQALLTKGIRISVIDRREENVRAHGFYFEGGLHSFVRHLAAGHKRIHKDIFYVHKQVDHMEVEVAFLYTESFDTKELSFANNIYTSDGGMHQTGFKAAMTRTVNAYAKSENILKEKDSSLTSDDIREGLVSVISVKLPEPQFEGQTKSRLGTPEARGAVESVVNEALKEFFETHPRTAKAWIEKVLLAAKARKAAKAAKDTVLRKGVLDGMTLPGKLADCSSRKPSESEIYIVEGDSAGGTAKMGRDRHTQAILPLRGKVLNVEKARLDKMLANNEIRALVVALGTAIGDEFDIEKLRYHKIVLMSDADVDGAHITTLLLTLFFRYFRPIIEGGFLYVARPPLYQVNKGKQIRYAYIESELEGVRNELAKVKTVASKKKAEDAEEEIEEGDVKDKYRGISVQRYKGLGEMNATQLWETTLNPENRLLYQVTVEDAEEADRLFDVLMGDVVAPRKAFIQTQALSVKNIDY